MDVMRKAIYMLSVLCVAALWGGCQRGGGEEGTAEVTLRFATRADGTDGTDPNALPNEGIKTLRVIVWDENSNAVFRNEKRNYSNEGQPLLEKEVKIYDLPLGTYTFYLIANEESLGKEYTNENLVFEEVNGVKKLLVRDEDNNFFPRLEDRISVDGLPMAGKSEEIEITKDSHVLEVTLERAVAKVKVNITNLTGKEIVVNKLAFGSFIADRLYLFRTVSLDIPEDAQYGSFIIGEEEPLNLSVPANGGSKEVVWYTYPSFAWSPDSNPDNSPYTLGISTAGNNEGYPPTHFVGANERPLNSLQRNVQLNINVSISAEAQLQIKFEVTHWNEETVTVPPFE